jgi:hypothetical protein
MTGAAKSAVNLSHQGARYIVQILAEMSAGIVN